MRKSYNYSVEIFRAGYTIVFSFNDLVYYILCLSDVNVSETEDVFSLVCVDRNFQNSFQGVISSV